MSSASAIPMNIEPRHIALLLGGWSPEREISLVSGRECAKALRRLGHQVTEIDVGRDLAQRLSETKPDLCFNALHGVGGEDGEVQGVLELMQIPYTHSGVGASAIAMDKMRSKILFADAGIPVTSDLLLTRESAASDPNQHPMDCPYVIKPVNQGSSVGITIIHDLSAERPACLNPDQWDFGEAVMIETYIPGRELTCGVMGKNIFEVLEITTKSPFYDYHAKYDPGGSAHQVPATIPDDVKRAIQEYSAVAHSVIGCRGVTRTDFRYDADGIGIIALEINTQPGMTPVSLIPEMAAATGMGFEQLVQWLVEDASCQR